ncbi:unnamed protein product [Rotaria sordida]|uniref:LamG domain-containing protein n=1 Tax=Rotaria sordida TaxID=392033 RepID=A0A819R754_9BILA|nr:unnamed protein product [Rotaria sordida]CAF4037550.1 unnamed protein product [Rotaria sordida]
MNGALVGQSSGVGPLQTTSGAFTMGGARIGGSLGICLTMWGLTSSGAVSVNVMNSSNVATAATSSVALPLNVWTHILQTSSPTNGNRLYINGVLAASVAVSSGRAVGPYVFIGASPTGTNSCPVGSIVPGQFYGAIDEYRVFGRELTTADICRLANP